MKTLREWVEERVKDAVNESDNATNKLDFDWNCGRRFGYEDVLEQLTEREELGEEVDGAYWKELFVSLLKGDMTHEKRAEFLRALGTYSIKPSNPGRWTDQIRALRAEKLDIAHAIEIRIFMDKKVPQELYDDEKRVSEELLVVLDDYKESTS